MIDSKILISLAGLLASVYAFNSIQDKKDEIKEHMTSPWGLQYSTVQDVIATNTNTGQSSSVQQGASIMVNKGMGMKPGAAFYTVPQNFQSQLAPRMFSGDYGANITYNLPSNQNLAVPENPLGYADKVIQENYTPDSCGAGGQTLSYRGGAPLMAPDYSQGNYQDVRGGLYEGRDGAKSAKASHAALPLGDMTVIDPTTGNPENVIIADRLMYANIKPANSQGLGDLIRGDLPIAPLSNSGWFVPSQATQPGQYLQQGAMNVMGGIDNTTSQQLANLVHSASGNVKTTIGGANLKQEFANPHSSVRQAFAPRYNNALGNVNMGSQYGTSLTDAQATVNVTAFP